jgi:hypothetical protein
MLRARVDADFKWGSGLLIWGDSAGMHALRDGLRKVVSDQSAVWVATESDRLTISSREFGSGQSVVRALNEGMQWTCSPDVLKHAVELIAPLLNSPGHQYIDAEGDVEQVVISCDEYGDWL